MNSILEKWNELKGQLEVLRTYYDRLTERERYIVLGSGAGGAIFLLLLVYLGMLTAVSSVGAKIETTKENIKKLEQLKSTYRQTERQVRDLDRMIRRTDADFQLATHLEKLAQKNGVVIESLKERPVPPNELYREQQVGVSVRQVTLRALIDFLYEIENSRQLLRIMSIQVKPNFQDPTQLNVTFAVSTFFPTGNG